MKKYVKAEVIAKNLPTGSYVAGCPSKDHNQWDGNSYCRKCEIGGR